MLSQSDHKPVFSSFRVPIKETIYQQYQEVKSQIHASITSFLKSITGVVVSATSLKFSNVYYKTKYSQVVTIQNQSSSMVVSYVKSEIDEKFWIEVTPNSVNIPANSVQDFTVNVMFTEADAVKGNIDTEYLKTQFAICIMGGDDFAISVEAEYMGSCFGASLHDLTKIIGAPTSRTKRLRERAAESKLVIEVPKVLHSMADFIADNANVLGLLEVCPSQEEQQTIRRALDTNSFTPRFSAHAVCSVMIEFLENLAFPLLEIQNFDIAAISESEQKSEEFYQRLNKVTEGSLKYFFKFLQKLLKSSENPKVICDYFFDPLTHLEKLSENGYKSSVSMQQRELFFKFLIESI